MVIYNHKPPLQLHLPEEAVNRVGFLQEKSSFKNRIKANRTTKFRSALGKSAVLREKEARPFWFVVRFNSSLLGHWLPSRRWTALLAIGVPLK